MPVGENQYGSVRMLTYSDGKVKVQNSNNLNSVQLAFQKAGVIDSYGNIISHDSKNDTSKSSIRRKATNAYETAAKEFWYTPKGVMRYNNGSTVVDDIQPNGWWYTIAFAMDKKPKSEDLGFLEG